MDKNNNGLFGFLQKPSLFQASPNTNASRKRSRSRSRSKDSRISDKLSNINAFDQRSIDSASKLQQKGQKFNYQYVNAPNNRAPQQRLFIDTQEINKNVTNSFTRNINLQGPKIPVENSAPVLLSTPNFFENNQRTSQNDNNLKNYQSTLNNNSNSSNQGYMPPNFGSNVQNTFSGSFQGNNNINTNGSTPKGPYQVLDKASKNGEISHHNRFDVPTSPQSKFGGFDNRSERFRQQDDQLSNFNRSIVGQPQNKVWADLVSYSASFEAARVESIQCLQSLSVRVGSQISNINHKIQSLNSKIASVLDRQFEQIRRRISQIIENAFRQKQRYIYDYMNRKQQQLAGEMIKIREVLQKESQNIQRMKERLRTSQWRQAAGQILSTEMEKKIESVIQKSHEMHLAQWEIGDIGSSHVKNIQKEFKELMNLKHR